MTACTGKGRTRRGAGLPAWMGARYRQGWRHRAVSARDDGRQAAQTGPAGESGRIWYAGSA